MNASVRRHSLRKLFGTALLPERKLWRRLGVIFDERE